MKNNLISMQIILTLLVFGVKLFSQDFTVKIEETDQFNGLIKPLKPEASHSFSMKVTNNSISPKCNVILTVLEKRNKTLF